jgi:predicted  nucleic acid-binding Zn-ribbon protein
MFPQVLTSRRYLFVPEAEYTRLGKELSTLKEEATNLEKAVDDHVKNEYALLEARRKDQLEGLESRARQLEAYVNYLRTQKRELEEETSY